MKFDEIALLNKEEQKDLFNNPKKLEEYVRGSMSLRRFEHSLGVAEAAIKIAKANNYSEQEAYLAGILHDICKEMPKEEQIDILKKNDPAKAEYPIHAIHGYAAKYYLQSLTDELSDEVLDAIYNHTICEKKATLNMIVFIADKREAGRKIEDGILNKSLKDLEGAYKDLVYDVERYLNSNGENSIRSCL